MDLPKLSNCECFDGSDLQNQSPLSFGYDFVPKGNITFTYNEARKSNFLVHFCSPFLFVIKEFVKRSKYSVIPVLIDSNQTINIDGSEEVVGPHMTAMYNKDVDIYLDYIPITTSIKTFSTISQARVEPILTVLSGIYPYKNTDSYMSAIHIFDRFIWLYLILSTVLVSQIISYESWKRNYYGLNFLKIFICELWTVFENAFLRKFLNKRSEKSIMILYVVYMWLGFIILNAFSTAILSTTMHNPYTVIDSLEDLESRPDLKVLLHLKNVHLNLIEKSGTDVERKYVLKGTKETENDTISNVLEMLRSLQIFKHRIFYSRTHVFISLRSFIQVLNTFKSKKDYKLSYIGSKTYFDHTIGFIYSKRLDESLGKIFDQIYLDIWETGLYDKWVEMAIEYAASVFEGTENQENFRISDRILYTVKIKPSIGPFIVGILVSSIVSLLEIVIFNKTEKTEMFSRRDFTLNINNNFKTLQRL